MSDEKKRAAIYARISLDRTGEAAGVERQREDCLALITGRAWTLVGEPYVDNSVSAAGTARRPGFESLLTMIESGRIDVVVAWSFDRLSRNRRDEVRLIEACKKHGVSVTLVRGGGDLDMSSAVGRGMAEMLATMGRIENEQKSERQRRMFEQKRAQGKPWGPTPAFGYGPDRVTIVRSEATLLREAYAAILAGASCRGIAATWNASGSTSRTGKPWSGAAVKRVLINPRYAGIRGTTVGAGNRRDLIEVGPAVWEGIVTEDVWRAVRAILCDPRRRSTEVRVRVHLLPGIARCGVCSRGLRSFVHSRGWPAYSCPNGREVVRKSAPVDAFIVGLVIERLSRPDASGLLVVDEGPDVDALREQGAVLRARLDEIAAAFGDGEMTREQSRIATERARTRLADVETEMSTVSRNHVLADLVAADDVQAVWGSLELDRRRAVISTLLDIVVHKTNTRGPGFDPATIETTWKQG